MRPRLIEFAAQRPNVVWLSCQGTRSEVSAWVQPGSASNPPAFGLPAAPTRRGRQTPSELAARLRIRALPDPRARSDRAGIRTRPLGRARMCQITKARTPKAPAKLGHRCRPPRSSPPTNSTGSPGRAAMRSALTAVQEHFASVPAIRLLTNIDIPLQRDRCFVARHGERDLRLEVEGTRSIRLSIRFSRSASSTH